MQHKSLRGLLKLNEPLGPYTSWRIGGPADKYYRPADSQDLAEFLKTVSIEEPLVWLGLGSNVLIHDNGVRGVVLHNLLPAGEPTIITENQEKKVIHIDAGLPCAKLAKYCAKLGLLGAEFFAGIPGTIGGVLAMNAGAWGGETWSLVKQVEVINRKGERHIRYPSDYTIGYRKVAGPQDEWFVSANFQFEMGDVQQATQKVKALLRQRNVSQPIGVFSCGSVFQNPNNDHAARLIEASHLKGFTIGSVQISEKHANFIINLGNARATDVWQLIQHIQAVVRKDHQIDLQTEVRLIGF